MVKVREIEVKTAIGKCGFPGGGWAVNPYVGCAHGCVYCYARFMKRFTGHKQPWGEFVDVRINIASVLEKQLKSSKYKKGPIFLGTVTDPYQPVEEKYQLTGKILEVLKDYQAPVSILTKSDLVLRDLDLLKGFKKIDLNFTLNTLDREWKKRVEPGSPSIARRLKAMEKLVREGIIVFAMVGPYWPVFTDPEALFKKFKRIGVSHVFSESLNTIGGNWTGVEEVLKKDYPRILPKFEEIFFNKKGFFDFYSRAEKRIRTLSRKYRLPATVYFGLGHGGKFN